jgi:hypothetical protein
MNTPLRSTVISTLFISMAAVPACGKRVRDANLEMVEQDMSKKEVESILGQPTSVEVTELPLVTQRKMLPATRYYYEQDGRTVVLHFVDDKFVKFEGSFEGTIATPTPAEEQVAAEPDNE